MLYTRNGQYSFQNAGIKVAVPQLDIRVKTDKTHYQPGELVNVELTSSLKGKPVSAQLTVGVVDEMIYALQPEIAPNIGKFSIRWGVTMCVPAPVCRLSATTRRSPASRLRLAQLTAASGE